MIDTVYALSSAPGKGGVAVIRVSGPESWNSLKSLICNNKVPSVRQADLRRLVDPVSRETLDEAVVIGFRAPASFTGEDIVEYHCHGSPAVIEGVLSALSQMSGHRPAEPGEFTRRAFENGKMDLTEAEAVADLIDAETQAQRRQALAQMGGALSRLYDGWRAALVKTLAYIEAVIDFPDEDVPDSEIEKMRPQIEKLKCEIKDHLNDNRRGERLRHGIHVAVIGAPNAGKSSLVNALARRDVAIVSDLAGTTRDVIEVHLDLGGYPVILSDTAGLRPGQVGEDAHGAIESEGIRRALQRAEEADIRLLLFDGSADRLDPGTAALVNEKAITVLNKRDVFESSPPGGMKEGIKLSVKTGEGLDDLMAALIEKIKMLIGQRETPVLTRARHRAALEECLAALEKSLSAPLPELMAEDLRLAVRALGRITGRVDVEDLLDVIFKDLCIGK